MKGQEKEKPHDFPVLINWDKKWLATASPAEIAQAQKEVEERIKKLRSKQ